LRSIASKVSCGECRRFHVWRHCLFGERLLGGSLLLERSARNAAPLALRLAFDGSSGERDAIYYAKERFAGGSGEIRVYVNVDMAPIFPLK
jgi:hypothetical protein